MVVKALDIRTNPPTEVAIKMLPRGDFVSPYLLGVCSRFLTICVCSQLALISDNISNSNLLCQFMTPVSN